MSESVSGRPAEIRRISSVYLFILYGLCALYLTGCTGYDGKNDLEEGSIFYRVSSSGRKAFVQALYWDLDPAHTEFVIPEPKAICSTSPLSSRGRRKSRY